MILFAQIAAQMASVKIAPKRYVVSKQLYRYINHKLEKFAIYPEVTLTQELTGDYGILYRCRTLYRDDFGYLKREQAELEEYFNLRDEISALQTKYRELGLKLDKKGVL